MAASTNMHFASASLYVGDLAPDVEETTLYEIFSAVGQVASIRVCRDTSTRKSLGYAYVNYHSVHDAERALDTLNHSPVKGVPCRIMWCHRDPSLRRSGTGNIFVKNLGRQIDNKVLYDTFSLFGNILSCKVATDEFGKSLGYGFVHYESEDAAKHAIEKINGMKIADRVVYVGPFKKRAERHDVRAEHFTNLYVKHIPAEWTEETLRSVFEPFGEITSSAINADAKERRFGFVNFADSDSAKRAVQDLHGKRTIATGVTDEPRPVEEESAAAAEKKGDATSVGGIAVNKETESSTAEKKEDKPSTEKKDDTDKTEAASAVASGTEGDATTAATVSAVTDAGDKAEVPVTTESVLKTSPSRDILDPAVPEDCLYVQRAMTKSERLSRLREAFTSGSNAAGAHSHLSSGDFAQSTGSSQTTPGSGNSAVRGVNLYVKNLNDRVTDDVLRTSFSRFGTVTSAKVMRDELGVSKGFGFVCFAFPEDATKAVTTMHLKIFQGKPLYVGLAEKRDHRLARLQQRYRMTGGGPPGRSAPPVVMMPPSGPGPAAGAMMAAPHQYGPAVYYGPPASMRGMPPQAGYPNGPMATGWRGPHPGAPFGGPGPLPGQPGQAAVYSYGQIPMMSTRGGPHMGRSGRGMPAPQGPGNFKFTPQARNQRQQMPAHQQPPMPQAQAPEFVGMPPVEIHANAVPGAPAPAGPLTSEGPLSAATLAAAHPQVQKQMLGEKLYPLVAKHQPELAGKITGMMLEMDNAELLSLLENEDQLIGKVDEALAVLQRHVGTAL